MAVKLSPLTFSKRIPIWGCFNSYFSSLSCVDRIQTTHKTHQNSPYTLDFEAKIQLLKNKLHPDSLTQVLDSTTDVESSLKLFKWASIQKRFRHNSNTYYSIISKLGMTGNIEEMEAYCNEMVKERYTGFGEALLKLLEYFVKYHRLDEALRVLYFLNSTSFNPDITLFNRLMGTIVEEKKDFKDVLFVYKEMVKTGIIPNIDTINYLLEALFESGRIETALDHYKRINKKGCIPNSKTFEIIITRLIACDRVNESLIVIDEMIKSEIVLDLKCYIKIIPLFCTMNNSEIAMKLYKKMRACQIFPDSLIYGVVIQCLCRNFQLDDAMNIFNEMIDNGLELDNDDVLLDIINGLLKLNKLDEARLFLEGKNIVKTNTHNVLVQAYCNVGDICMAKHLFDEMLERNLSNSLSWNIIIGYFCKNGKINKAMEVLSRMIVSSIIPDCTTYSSIILGKCKSGKIDNAFMLFSHVLVKKWVLDSVSYLELILCLCQMKRINEASEVFKYMESNESSYDYGSLFEECLLRNSETLRNLLTVLNESSKRGLFFSVIEKNVLNCRIFEGEMYNILIEGLWKEGYKNRASELLDRMLEDGWVPDSTTHALLMGYDVMKKEDDVIVVDEVSCILEDSLGEICD